LLFPSHNKKDIVSHPYKTTDKIITPHIHHRPVPNSHLPNYNAYAVINPHKNRIWEVPLHAVIRLPFKLIAADFGCILTSLCKWSTKRQNKY
jgi:hypothetical protein